MNEPQYFNTQNRQLAFALATAGCRFAPQDAGGPAINTYTIGKLREMNVPRGTTLEDGAAMLVAQRVTGAVTYLFERDDTFFRAMKAWDDMVDEFQSANRENRPPNVPDIDVEQVMRTLYVHAHNQKQFRELAWINTPLCSSIESSTQETPVAGKPAPRSVTTGRGRIWSIGASDKTKERLHV